MPGAALPSLERSENETGMTTFVLRRLLGLIPVLLGISVVVFLLMQLIPGDVAQAMLGLTARPQDIANLREALGLNEPIYVQYVKWLGHVVQGDLGTSLQQRTAVLPFLLERFQNTLLLTTASTVISLLIGLPAGIISATKQYSIFDRVSMLIALFGNSMPAFWLGLMSILIFSLELGWLPTGGMWPMVGDHTFLVLLKHLAMPAITLGAASAAITARITRSSMLEVIRQDYVRTARAKGLNERAVLTRHTLKNALLPILTVVSFQFGFLLGGAVLTETVFNWPGVGLALYNAISFRDYPMVQGGVLVVACAFVVVNLVTDLLYAVIDPRIKYS
jgi:peptide/nickel transport system permease protein